MAYTTGTATSHNDLLDKLRLYLVAQGWTQLAWTAGATVNDPSTLHVRGPGAGAGKQVFVSVKTFADAPNSIYSWELRGAVDYNAALAWGAQLGQSPQQCYLNLWASTITYWFYVNDRRFVVVAKCSTNYMSAHAGFILPWGTPAQYPFPLYIVGDFYEQQPYSYSYAGRRMITDPGNYTTSPTSTQYAGGYMRSATGIWYPTGNHGRSSNTNYPTGYDKGQRALSWPHHCGYAGAGNIGSQYYPLYWNGGTGAADAHAFESLVPTQQGERPVWPVMIMPGDQAPLGVLDGVYAVGGTGLTTEQVLTLGARTFKVFQNINRNSPDDFFCVEQV